MKMLIWAVLLALPQAHAGNFSLEGGLRPALKFPAGSAANSKFVALGITGTASYEIERWSFGGRIIGAITNSTDFHIPADTFDLRGELHRREYGIEVLSRYFFLDADQRKRWYVEFGFMGIETELVHIGRLFVLPNSPDYTRLFLRGGGFSIGAGLRPLQGPYFFQLNYELIHYENLEVVGSVNHLHPIVDEPPLNRNYFVHSIVLVVGMDVFGR